MRPTSKALTKYHKELSQKPLLRDADEEFGLILRWQQNKDETAKKLLLEAHLRFVIKKAAKFAGTTEQLEEYVAAGNIGLIEALNRYDIYRKPRMRFLTYAACWIENKIHAERYNETIVHVPVYLQKQQRKDAKTKSKQFTELGGEVPNNQLDGGRISLDVVDVLGKVELGSQTSKELQKYNGLLISDIYKAQLNTDEKTEISDLLYEKVLLLFDELLPVERTVLNFHFGLKDDPKSDEEIAAFFLTEDLDKIRRIRVKALKRLKRLVL